MTKEDLSAPFEIIPKASVNPDCITIYNEILWTRRKTKHERLKNFGDTDKKHHGKVSSHARRKIGKAIEYTLFMANDKVLPDTAHGRSYKFRIAFITLTLPSHQIHTDNEIKDQCLNQLLVELRKRYQVHNYVWRAEKQKNGNIHFHLLVDRFIPWSELRDRWNRIVNKLGYVDRYRDEMRRFHSEGFQVREKLLEQWSYKSQVRAYKAGKANDWASPNSTDIHAVHKVRDIKRYVSKYATKDEENGEVTGRMWGCSESLSQIKGGQIEIDSQVFDELNKIVDEGKARVYQGDHFSVIYINIQSVQHIGCRTLFQHFASYMLHTFNYSIQSTLNTS
jgi:hypothetical protein